MTTAEYQTGVLEIGDNAYAFVQPNAMTNAGIIVGDDGVAVVDSLMTPDLAKSLKAGVKRITNKPIKFFINTHYHGDHTFGNEFFKPSPIIAHVNCRNAYTSTWTSAIKRFSTEIRPDLADDFGRLTMTPPEVVFENRMTIFLGDRPIELAYYGKGHTTGDIVIYLPKEQVAYAGDLVFNRVNPVAAEGYVSSWMKVLQKITQLDINTVVPGHGPIGSKDDLRNLLNYFREMKQECKLRYDSGISPERAVADLKLRKYDSWLRKERIPTTVKRLYMEFSGELR